MKSAARIVLVSSMVLLALAFPTRVAWAQGSGDAGPSDLEALQTSLLNLTDYVIHLGRTIHEQKEALDHANETLSAIEQRLRTLEERIALGTPDTSGQLSQGSRTTWQWHGGGTTWLDLEVFRQGRPGIVGEGRWGATSDWVGVSEQFRQIPGSQLSTSGEAFWFFVPLTVEGRTAVLANTEAALRGLAGVEDLTMQMFLPDAEADPATRRDALNRLPADVSYTWVATEDSIIFQAISPSTQVAAMLELLRPLGGAVGP